MPIHRHHLGNNAVYTEKIKDAEVKTADIADLNVTTPKITDLAVTVAKLADNAVETAKIKDGAVTIAKIANFMIGLVVADPPSIAAGAAANIDLGVTGLTVDHFVTAECQDELEAGLVPIAVYVPSADVLRIRLYNPTSGAIDGASRNWRYVAIK